MQLAFESPAVIVLLDLLDLLVPAGGTPEEDERQASPDLLAFNGSRTTAVESGICEIAFESSPELAEFAARLGINRVFAVTVPVSGDAESLLPLCVTATISVAIANTAQMPAKTCHRLRPL